MDSSSATGSTPSSSNKTGAELLSSHVVDVIGTDLPFTSKILIDDYLQESWQPLPYAENVRYKAISGNNSSLTLLNTSLLGNGRETRGSEISFIGSDGARLSNKILQKEPQNGGYGPKNSSIALDWAYIGSKAVTSDDLKISLKISANDVVSSHPEGEKLSGGSSFNVLYDAGGGATQLKAKGSDTYTVITNSVSTINEINTASLTYSYIDSSGDSVFKFSFSGNRTEDLAAGTMSFSWKNISAQMGALKMTTKIYSGTSETALGLSTLLDIDNANDHLQNLWLPLIAKGNNSFVGGSESDMIDASAGNDTVSGNQGDDFLQGGTGYDQIAGGTGADLFLFAAGDSSLSENTSDLIKDFKYSEGDQFDLSGLPSIRCAVNAKGVSSFDAALAAAREDFDAGRNVSIQFNGKGAVLIADMNLDSEPDLAVRLVGIKAGDSRFAEYAENGDMFTGGS